MEVLSPAGNKESLIAAVRSGADAIYLGIKKFNARNNAQNFDFTELKECVEYAHERSVKIYITLNIILYNYEFNELNDIIISLAECGVDAFICADYGVISFVKKILPSIPIHASTQMSVHTKEALYLLKDMGISRVVPSRELTGKELTDFCKLANELGIEVEVFVHGALCMSMSGLCLMSYSLGGRSGNRGLCAGTCRLPFSTVGGNGYALSLKDLSLIDEINELKEMGVSSLKIEGRMKSVEYVAVVTTMVKRMVLTDNLSVLDRQLLSNIFARSGFTSGYYKNIIGKSMFGVRSDLDVENSKSIKNKTHELYRSEYISYNVSISLKVMKNRRIILSICDDTTSVVAEGDIPPVATNVAADKSYLESIITKLGGTPLSAKSCEVFVDDGLFVSKSYLNSLKRKCVKDFLIQKKILNKKVYEVKTFPRLQSISTKNNKGKFLLYFSSVKDIPENLPSEVYGIILPAEKLRKYKGNLKLYGYIYPVMYDKSYIDRCFDLIEEIGAVAICNNLSAIQIAKSRGISFVAGINLNIVNSYSCEFFEKLGAKFSVLSLESKLNDIRTIGSLYNTGLVIYGTMPLMYTRNCPIKNGKGCSECNHYIVDRMNISFPVYCKYGFSVVYNSRPIYLSCEWDKFAQVDYLIFNFNNESKENVINILNDYLDKKSDYKPKLYIKEYIK